MSDISQCKHSICERSSTCYRFTAIPESDPLKQDYRKFQNICGEWNSYKWYWEVKQEIVQKEENENKDVN